MSSNGSEEKVTQLIIKLLCGWSNKVTEEQLKSFEINIDQVNQVIDKVKQFLEDDNPEEALPTFIFETRLDGTQVSPEPHKPFLCVYEFCVALEMFCKSKKMDIEKHWDRLLLKTSAHNADRFMWIHMNLITQPTVRLSWEQVVQRLMLKYDDPRRTQSVKRALQSFYFDPVKNTESIEIANRRFVAYVLETHCDPSEAIGLYVNGMPESCRQLLRLTMSYDKHTGFNYCLKDIVQRSSIFVTAKDDDYVFYSKTARIAVSLPMEKVNSKMCEFHILPTHTTADCPDYSILKYPYLDPMAVENEFSKLITQNKDEPVLKHNNTSKTQPSYIPDSLPNEVQVKRESISEREHVDRDHSSYSQPQLNPKPHSKPHPPHHHRPSHPHSSLTAPSLKKRRDCYYCGEPFFWGHNSVCKKFPPSKKLKK